MKDDFVTRFGDAARAIRDMLYGATVYDWVREFEKQRGELERFFVLVVFGDMLGIPILPSYHALRLLPFTVPRLESWKRSVLRERDITDMFDSEIG